MVKREGKHTANARVDVDYSSGKPKIKFDYPGKNPGKDALSEGSNILVIVGTMILFGLIPWGIIFMPGMIEEDLLPNQYPEECVNLSLNKLYYNSSIIFEGDINFSSNKTFKTIYGFNITCDNITRIIEYKRGEGIFKEYQDKGILGGGKEVDSGIALYAFIFLSLIIYRGIIMRILVRQKWYQKWLPKANADGVIFKRRKKKYSKFKSKDVLNNVIVIPYFSNVELDYKTTGDFNEYLENIKIREYRTRTINMKSKKKSKLKVSHGKWYAVFIFKEKPKNGYLEVIYQ